MKIFIEPVLYTDIQAEKPASFCERCDGERYAPSLICSRCERNGL